MERSMITWVENKIFARIALALNAVHLGWLRFREASTACNISDSRTVERKERLKEKQARIYRKMEECEQRGELLCRQISAKFKKPDLKRVA